jgi:predicted nucleic acid-binding protein
MSGAATIDPITRHDPCVVDTDVVSFLFKNDPRAHPYLALLRDRELLVSFMTEAELEQWVLLAKWGADRTWGFLAFMNRFASVPSSRDLILQWAAVMVAARANGRRIEAADAWIAATALLYAASLVTHNSKDYLGVPNLIVHSRP